jgi:AAA domain
MRIVADQRYLDDQIERADRNQELKTRYGISYTRFADIDPAPIKNWLVKDFLGAGEMSCAYGPPGSAKSLLAGDLAAHVAWGQDWMGRRVSQGAVLFVAIERAGLVKRRLAGLSQYHGIAELPLAVISGSIDLRSNRTGADGIIECAKRLEDESESQMRLIVVDTVSRALAGGNENGSEDMGALVQNVLHIQEGTGAHVLLTHHVPHDQNRMRGHGALLAACDTTLRIEGGDLRTATVEKTNDGAEGERIAFAIESVDLGSDPQTGDVTTAPVIRPTDLPKAITAEPRLTKNQKTMLSLLHTAGPNGLTTEAWNEKARAAGIGINRRADLVDIHIALKSKHLVREYNDRWNVSG